MRKLIIIVALATLIPASLSAQQRTPGARRARPGAAAAPRNGTRPADAEARRGRDSVSDPVLDRILQIDSLKLTDDQVAKLRSISEKARMERQKEIAKQRKEMQTGDTLTDEQKETLKAELRKTQEKTRKDLMDVLTKEQRRIVEERLKSARRKVAG